MFPKSCLLSRHLHPKCCSVGSAHGVPLEKSQRVCHSFGFPCFLLRVLGLVFLCHLSAASHFSQIAPRPCPSHPLPPARAMDSSHHSMQYHLARALMHLNQLVSFLPSFELPADWGRNLGGLMNICRERTVPNLHRHEEQAIFTFTKFLNTHQLNFQFSGMEAEISFQVGQTWGVVISPDDIKLTIPQPTIIHYFPPT